MEKESKDSVKSKGRIYTPKFIVDNILDFIGYNGDILEKNIIDNSCGDGAFLIGVINRYCSSFLKKYGSAKKEELKDHLEKFIHGIEIEESEQKKCIVNLNNELKKFEIANVDWDIICADTLTVNKFYKKMDFVVGNPPYVRVHNLADSYKEVKKYFFSENGMTDLYIVFFEIGLKMLNDNGKMCLITPSSCLKSRAGNNFRKYIFDNKNLTKVIDLGHFQPFNATTYTMITLFEMGEKNDDIEYYTYDEKGKTPLKNEVLNYSEIFINGNIYLSKKDSLLLLRNIENYSRNILKKISVKNGFATLADNIFIGDFKFDNYTIDVYKASTGKWRKCIFPYDNVGRPLSISQIKNNPSVFNYLQENRDLLEKRSLTDSGQWFLFGRTQAIKDVFKDKIAINTIIKDINSIKMDMVPAGCGVYSGLYILTDYTFDEIKEVIRSNEFLEYVKLLKNYKSGGYYTFSSAELQKFLVYKLRKNFYEQSSIFTISGEVVY
ncbi:MAG: N-6 DNA methylase [bacterium]|nr:N-6 DNA methylase [bacterium]